MLMERPRSALEAIEIAALSPKFGSTPNLATELYQVQTRSGFYFKGTAAPQAGTFQGSNFYLGGGGTQVFMPARPNPLGGYPIPPWVHAERLPYGN